MLLAACGAETVPRVAPLAPDAVVLAFGDSLTYGTGAPREQGYPAVLAELIDRRVVNAGLPGEISAAGLSRLPRLLAQHRPALLLLCHGGNDLLRRMPEAALQDHLAQMVALARAQGAEVVLIGVPRPTLFALEPAPLYAAVAEQENVPLLADALAELEADADMKADRIHLNAAGYAALAQAIADLLRQAGALAPFDTAGPDRAAAGK